MTIANTIVAIPITHHRQTAKTFLSVLLTEMGCALCGSFQYQSTCLFSPQCYTQWIFIYPCYLKCCWVVLNADISNKKLFFFGKLISPAQSQHRRRLVHTFFFQAPYVDGLPRSPHGNVNKSGSQDQSGLCVHLF